MNESIKVKLGRLFSYSCGLLVAFFSMGLVSSSLMAGEKAEVVFPEVEGKSLHGDVVSFPSVFEKKAYHVVVIAFLREQQELVDTWLPKLDALAEERMDFEFFELPTISRMNAFMRWFIYRGMRSGIKEDVTRSRTVTLHIDKEPLKEALGIDTEESIFVVLVDDQGNVLQMEKEVFDEEKWGRLVAEMRDSKSE